jgi:NADH:ubiquinone oxidoreductase subunit C
MNGDGERWIGKFSSQFSMFSPSLPSLFRLFNLLLPAPIAPALLLRSGDLYLHLSSPQQLLPFLFFLRHHSSTRFLVLSDIWCADYPSRRDRFSVTYCLLSCLLNVRIYLRVSAATALPSVVSLFPSAGWLEREIWDLFGLFFAGHPDLRRLLTDYGFEGFPLRKDFPLGGFLEVRYDDQSKRVVLEPLELSQEYRFFDFRTPWESEGAVPSLPPR